jgi:hypothetical protein
MCSSHWTKTEIGKLVSYCSPSLQSAVPLQAQGTFLSDQLLRTFKHAWSNWKGYVKFPKYCTVQKLWSRSIWGNEEMQWCCSLFKQLECWKDNCMLFKLFIGRTKTTEGGGRECCAAAYLAGKQRQTGNLGSTLPLTTIFQVEKRGLHKKMLMQQKIGIILQRIKGIKMKTCPLPLRHIYRHFCGNTVLQSVLSYVQY